MNRPYPANSIRRLACVATALLLAALSVAAAGTLDDYRSRVKRAVELSEGLHNMLAGDSRGADVDRYVADTIRSIRAALPERETVAFDGGEVEVSNRWLRTSLDDLQRESSNSRRARIALEINERLAAIASQLAGGPARADQPSKDSDKQKLAEILARDEYQKPEPKRESLIERWIRELLEWLARLFPQPQIGEQSAGGFGAISQVLQVVVYAAIIGLLGFAIFKLAPRLLRRLGGEGDGETDGERIILGERVGAERSARDLMNEADELARAGDVRGAIRKGYIAFLCELHDRKLVSLSREKTNRDLLRDVRRRRAPLFDKMKALTARFERHWYGLRPAGESEWESFRKDYHEALRQDSGS
ncbi:MAG: DUF4129 domain-containing protein [Pyrinomonadaceae bacterium]